MDDERFLFEMPDPVQLPEEISLPPRKPLWTECKAKLIERYLRYFVFITRHGTYIDAFAGPQEPSDATTWSAKLVLESRPRWFRHFHFFELDTEKVTALQELRDSQSPPDKTKSEPKRDVTIYPGDFNVNLPPFLEANPIADKEATFSLLDQRTFECDWASVEQVANHKKGGHKIELFYFFPEGWIDRSVAALNDKDGTFLRWWGKSEWGEFRNKTGVRRATFVKDRIQRDLKYRFVNAWPIYEKRELGGKVMYYMFHATDHPEAPKLMSRAYHRALDVPESPEQLEWIAKTVKGAAC
jgi:three-Cys-motif partner protein